MADVELFWDPVCPFCWVTSRWVRRVQRARGLDVAWRFISLRFLNEPLGYDGKPEFYPAVHARGTELLRVAASVRASHGPEPMGELYRAIGEALWEQPPPRTGDGDGDMNVVARHQLSVSDWPSLLESLGLEASHAEAMNDDAFDEVIRADTDEALNRVGGDVGTPIITFDPPDGPSFFGPVIADDPDSDDEAVATWEAVETLARWPGFAELKRTARSFPVTKLTASMTGQTTRMG